MTDPDKQAAFVSGLRKLAEDAAAKNPTLGDMRTLAKGLVNETRTRIADGQPYWPRGAYMGKEGDVSMVKAEAKDPNQATVEILLQLTNRAELGSIRAAAMVHILDKPVPIWRLVKFIQVHTEHATGKAFISAVPADETDLLAGAPGINGAAVSIFGGPTQDFPPSKLNLPEL